jgi:hypothetical protein
MEKTMATKENKTVVTIKPANMKTIAFKISGTAPLLQNAFSQGARDEMMSKMASASTSRKGKKREARDYEQDMKNATHLSEDWWQGIPASAFRSAMISACRLVGFKMTIAKMSVFILADGLDAVDGMPLVRFEGEPERHDMAARVGISGTDIRVRPMWRKWSANLNIRFDADQFTETDVANLLQRAGMQVGIGEGRPDSRSSTGLGLGTFEIV